MLNQLGLDYLSRRVADFVNIGTPSHIIGKAMLNAPDLLSSIAP